MFEDTAKVGLKSNCVARNALSNVEKIVEFTLSLIKIVATCGFIILGVVIDCGGVNTDPRGYIGAHYWHDPGAFANGFKGFCSVFVTAAFAFGGTELVGLAAAEAANPRKTLPQATKQVFWRITFFYVVSLFIIGLIVPYNNNRLLDATGANTKASPFVLAIQLAGIKGLPSVFNAVITISVLSVANSCTFGSTRTMQALADRGMAPSLLKYIDSKGRPLVCIVIQLLFGLLAFVNEAAAGPTVFNWLLALSGLSNFFVWASINLSHIRFRAGWKAQGHTLDELPYQASFGVIGSYIGFFLNVIALIATFYVSLFVSSFHVSIAGGKYILRTLKLLCLLLHSPLEDLPTRMTSFKSTSQLPSSSLFTLFGRSRPEAKVVFSSEHLKWT